MTLFDTHVHLADAQFDADREGALDRALAAGVAQVVEIADSPDDWDRCLALARARPSQIKVSLGLHPYYADRYDDSLLARLETMIRLPEVVAVGEIGLDYAKATVGRAEQKQAFEALLLACKSWDKPVVIHCRDAYENLRAILQGVFPSPRASGFWGVVHCFSGTAEDALFCRDRGFALGVDGPVTYPKNDALREALRQAGPDCLVLETDSPYLPPQSLRGKRNEPANVAQIAARLAEVCGLLHSQLAEKTTRNGRNLYRLPA